MTNILKLIEERHSSRVPFDRERPVAKQDVRQILEAGAGRPRPTTCRTSRFSSSTTRKF
jgi:nitroreductase